jgi:hypothetical protein
MRECDKLKGHNLDNSSKHDEIVLWLYNKLKDEEFCKNELFPNFEVECKKIDNIEIEFPIFGYPASFFRGTGSRKLIGFADLKCSLSYNEGSKANIYFEIKTKINVGEVLRQIKYYCSQDNIRQDTKVWIVVAEGNQYKDILRNEGVHYIEYKK